MANAAQRPGQEDLDEKPWKYIGYPGFVAYVASDDDFFVLKRFDKLHSRVLLRLQDGLAALEERLDALDASMSAMNAEDVDNGTLRNDKAERQSLLDTIEEKLNSYDEMLQRYLQLKSRPTASKTNIRNMTRWLANRKDPIHEKETRFLQSKDLISLSRAEKSPARRIFEQQVLAPTMGLFGLFQTKPDPADTEAAVATTVQGEDKHVDLMAAISIFTTTVVMLIVPLWILAVCGTIFQKLAVITAFTIVFLAVMGWGTLARPFEILAATAGYCAVLVVFLQLGGSAA